jgi:pimeloyl-ACP methyl ester carboxylesterase
MFASNSMQTLNRLPSLSIRAITFVLILIVGMMGTSAYASDAAGKINPAVSKASPNNQESPTKSGDISERFEIVDKIKFAPSIESFWPLIIDGLAEARGGNYSLFFQFLPSPSGVPFLTASTLDAFTAIQCNDFGTRRSAAEYLPVDEVAGALTPRMEGRFRVAAATAVCASWPKNEVPIIHNVKNQIANPILMIGNDFDPNTPLSWTRSLARALGMERSLVRYQGGGHLAYAVLGNACIDRVGDAYLFDLTLPDEGFTCPARPIRFRPAAAPVDAAGKRMIDAIKRDLLRGQPMRVRQ